MSAAELQRVTVRMLYDASFVEAVYREDAAALADVPLTSDERRWLVAADRRVWSADPMRRRRSLKALLDEFRVSSALAAAATRRLSTLDAFFSSPFFHGCIQRRGSMALAYADYLGSLGSDARLAAVVKLERAMAQARRGRRPATRSGQLDLTALYVLAPHVVPLRLPAGTMELVHAVEQVLFEISLAPIAALVDDGPDLTGLPPLGEPDAVTLTAEKSAEGDDVSLAESAVSLVGLLEFAQTPRTGAQLVDEALGLGAEAGEVRDVLQPLLDETILMRAAPR